MKKIPSEYERLVRWLIVIILTSIILLGITQCSAQCPSTPSDTIQGNNCTFITINPPAVANQVVTNCVLFKPETEYINMDYIRIQSTTCGPVAYNLLDFEIFNNSICDTLIGSGEVYPTPSNVFQGPLDTSIYYTLCVTWRAMCTIDGICLVYLPSYLPVTLYYFGLEVDDNDVYISWVTQSEVNCAYFLVERANSKFVFRPVLKVYGSGNSSKMNMYQTIDQYPKKGISYYRLIQVDYDGTRVVYDPVPCNVPNPDPYNIWEMYDIIGRQLINK